MNCTYIHSICNTPYRQGIEENNGKNIDFASNIGLKSHKKARPNWKNRKIDNKPFPGTAFSAKVAFWVTFWDPKGIQKWSQIYETF